MRPIHEESRIDAFDQDQDLRNAYRLKLFLRQLSCMRAVMGRTPPVNPTGNAAIEMFRRLHATQRRVLVPTQVESNSTQWAMFFLPRL